MSMETVPRDLKNLRACMVCSIIKTFDQFEMDGCDNCEEFLHMKNNKENVYDFTSSNFDGMICAMSMEDSWVCKWQRISPLATPNQASALQDILTAEGILEEVGYPYNVIFKISTFVVDGFVKGVYAVSVAGRPPANVIKDMKNRGIVYKSRDTSQR